MKQRDIRVTRHTPAPVEVVWDLVSDVERWPEWTFVPRARLERAGAGDPNGVGAIRRFPGFPQPTREEVVVFEPPTTYGYVMLSGMPVHDYRSEFRLSPAAAGGTDVTWHSTFRSRWLGYALMRAILFTFSKGLVKHAGR